MILLNPGPVNLSERVRAALAGPDLCHREPEFADLQGRVIEALTAVYELPQNDWRAVLVSGSGTAAVEAMIASLVPREAHLVTLENGVYGERLTTIARAHGIAVTPLTTGWDSAIDESALADILKAQTGPTWVAAIHHETTTGRLNDLAAIGEICRHYHAPLLVDGVSSFGAERLAFSDWNIAACAATANKCLHGAPGMAFVIVREKLLASSAGRSVYLDLGGHARAQAAASTAFTPAIPALYALDAALAELEEEGGWQARHEHYHLLAEKLRGGLADLNISPWLAEENSSVVLRSYNLPSGFTYEQLHDQLKQRGFVIYAGQAGLVHELFRLSTMGAIEVADIERLLSAFAEILH